MSIIACTHARYPLMAREVTKKTCPGRRKE